MSHTHTKTSCVIFFFYKIREQEGGTDPVGVEVGTNGRGKKGRRMWKGAYSANAVYTCI
jgi:hypothetical protein